MAKAMDDGTWLQLRLALAERQPAVAERWRRAVLATGVVPVGEDVLQRRFAELTEQVHAALFAEPFERRAAEAIGAGLTELHLVRGDALARTQEVLAGELLAGLSPQEVALLQPRLQPLLAGLTAGFVARAQQILLQEQESIRGALLAERRRAEAMIRDLNADLERRVQERTAQLRAANADLVAEVERRRQAEAERADLLGREQEALRLALLDDVSTVLAASIDYQTTLQRVADLAVPALADWCAVDILDDGGAVRRLASARGDTQPDVLDEAWPPAAADAGDRLGIRQVIRSGEPLVRTLAPEAVAAGGVDRLPDGRSEPRAASLLCVPLAVHGRVLGALSFVRQAPGKQYRAADIPLAQEVARRAALAIDNARLYRDLQDAVRVRDEFLSVAAHELKTPLTSVLGFAQLLQRRLETQAVIDPVRLGQAVRRIDQQSRKLARLIERLLDISRLDHGQLRLERQWADLSALVAAVVRGLPPESAVQSIELSAPPELLVWIDPVRLEQAIVNVLDNALRYAAEAGAISVEVVAIWPATARIVVTDHGPGIPPERRDHLFERFFQAHGDSHASGIGLGLYLARQILELHGGRLEAEFPDSGGSRFTLTLPVGPGAGPN